MSLNNAIVQTVARLEAVEGVENVFSYVRGTKDQVEFKRLFASTAGPIQAWMVTRDGTRSVDEGPEQLGRTHNITILGFASLNDLAASETAFQNLVERICEAFDTGDRRFGGLFDWSGPTQVMGPVAAMWGQVLVHAVKIVNPVKEYPDGGYTQ